MKLQKIFMTSVLCAFITAFSFFNTSYVFEKSFTDLENSHSLWTPTSVNQAYAAPSVPNTPRDANKKVSPVYVEFEGNDSIGSLLSTRLKEHFNTSNLFRLEGKDVPKFRILVSSVSEFETRPSIGSAYSVIWLFSLSDATLRHYLAMDLGLVSADSVNDLVARLVEKTDSLVTRYDYLFPKQD